MADISNDDEDMADLFSFGSGDQGGGGGTATPADDASSPPVPLSAAPFRSSSDDEFLDLLEDSPELLSGPTVGAATTGASAHDTDTQEILAWLDEEKAASAADGNTDKNAEATEVQESGTASATSANSENPASPKSTKPPSTAPTETVVALPPVFKSLTAALASSQATVGQVRRLAAEQCDQITSVNRPDLYCRLLSGKSLHATQKHSSLVDSFNAWQGSEARKDELPSPALSNACEALAKRVAESMEKTHATHRDKEDCRQDLLDVLQYHMRGQQKSTDGTDDDLVDVFLPPVAATLLALNIPAPVTSTLLQQIMAQYMPLLALQDSERWEAAQGLHQHLYWLACYHLPLLVFHLDRYWPGWCGPRMPKEESTEESPRRGKYRGLIPPSWLVSLLAGDTTFLPVTWMGQVWDWILTAPDRFVPFFLTLAVLENAADDLILLTGEELCTGFEKAFDFDQSNDWLEYWNQAAQALQTATPASVLDQLEKAEDEAVQQALARRQERAEAALNERLEAEKRAHMEEQERKADEARRRLNRARLVAFYRTHAPDKEGNIDQILENYGDKLDILEAKLFKKYGVSFNPALKEKPKEVPKQRGPNKLLASMNSKRQMGKEEKEELSPSEQIEAPAASRTDQVSVLVKAEEVLPVICWSKEAAAMRGANRRTRKSGSSEVPLRFFLVDGRSEEVAEEQGRFPTAASLSPETMLDPEKLQKAEERFESLRGAIHIVVMGEGLSAIPKLYNQKLSPQMEEAMKQDDSQTNICALFFFKKGFPFVSILDGGFAAAHSWLVREGPNHHLDVSSVLVDYDAERSIFGQMEKLHNASATEKASRAMQSLMEKSIVAMTIQARNLERIASDMEQGKGRFGMGFLSNRAKSQTVSTEKSKNNDENKGPRFVNLFANKSNDSSGTNADVNQGSRFGNMFSRQKTDEDDAESNPAKSALSSGDPAPVPFRNPFARKEGEGEKAADQGTSMSRASIDDGTDIDGGAKPAIANPFKGLGVAINNTVNRSNEGSATTVDNPQGDNKPALPTNPFKGLGAKLNNTMNRNAESTSVESTATVGGTTVAGSGDVEAVTDETSGDKRSRFGGFGAAFNNATKAEPGQAGPPAVPNMLKRNPFRGFGGVGAKKAPDDNNKQGGGFGGGFNSLRTFGRSVRPGAKDPNSNVAGGNDESITFN